jgi:predicted DNA-binding mobile mystery protein A
MTAAQLAERLGVHKSRIGRIEKDETRQAVTLKTLQEVANCLECDLVYALVPRKSIHEILKQQAYFVAQTRLKLVQHTMTLENQALTPHQFTMILEQEVDTLLHGPLKYIWDNPNNENN